MTPSEPTWPGSTVCLVKRCPVCEYEAARIRAMSKYPRKGDTQ